MTKNAAISRLNEVRSKKNTPENEAGETVSASAMPRIADK